MMTEEKKQAFSNLRKALVACNRLNYCESAITELEDALTQPASPALKLPETISVRTAIAALDNASEVTTIAQSYKMAWNSCIAETKRLNAPHTAPIDPICATCGAEWVKCSERMPKGEIEVLLCMKGGFVLNAVYVYDEDADDFRDYQDIWDPVNASLISHWTEKPAAPEEK